MADAPDCTKEPGWRNRVYDLVMRRFTRWLLTTVVIAALVSGIVAWAFTPWKTDFAQYPVGTAFAWMQDHIFILLVGGISVAVMLALLTLLHRRSDRVELRPQAILMTQADRRFLLIRLGSLYKNTVKQSLLGMARIELGLERTFEATVHPAMSVSYRPADIREAISPGTSILDVYKDAVDGLLILGKPGAGKSTLLYELALALTERAEHDKAQLPPVLVSLSSWAVKRLPLEQWLAEELFRYQIPCPLAAAWLQADQLLPLLDGLDEMTEDARSACIEAINAYRQKHPLPIVVCGRSAEYFSQERRLSLQGSIEVLPLSEMQVQYYLKQGKQSLAAVRRVLSQSVVLQELLTTPLMLSVIILAYRDKSVKDLPRSGTVEDQQQQIFECYIKRVLERPLTRRQLTPEQIRRRLTWLAQQMKKYSLTEFYLEQMQPAWLATKRMQTVFFLLYGLLNGLLVGLVSGLAFGLVFGSGPGLYVGLFVGIAFAVSGMFIDWQLRPEIQPADMLTWSWSWQDFWIALLAGAFIFGAIDGLRGRLDLILPAAMVGGSGGALFALLRGLLKGFVTQPDVHMRTKPNEGIHNSGRYTLFIILLSIGFFGLVGAFIGGIFGWSSIELGNAIFIGLRTGIGTGLVFGLFYGLDRGGRAYLEHYLLRVFLWLNNTFPWRTTRLLEMACNCILLQRVGGGYRFIHPLFQEYFASQGETASPSVAPSHPSPC